MNYMNKYEGLMELSHLGVPCIEWNEYNSDMELSENVLWTVRVANKYGKDMCFPCKLGVSANEALEYADHLNDRYDLVMISEYFSADISGNLGILADKIVIEWTYGNSRNLTEYGFFEESISITDREDFENKDSRLNKKVYEKLFQYGINIKNTYRGFVIDNKFVILEWSIIAEPEESQCQKQGYKGGKLIFYDLRIV